MKIQHLIWPTSSPTLEDKLKEANYRPSGFDYMRLLLAVSVIVYHSVVISYGWKAQQELISSIWRPFMAGILPMFFVLSGFLVAGSLERNPKISTFLGLRVLRIMPALSVEVLISALILGSLLTALPLSAYFSDPQFAIYFWNILGHIHYELPGLFLSNPLPKIVNGQLWTVPWELACYIALTALAILGMFKHRIWLLLVIGTCYGAHFLKTIYKFYFHTVPYDGGGVAGHTLVMIFVTGLMLYRYRDKIPYNGGLCIIAFLVSWLLLAIPPHGDGFIALPIAYITVYIGLMNPLRNKTLLSGDYSYGIFLYGFPIQQAFASMGPSVHHWYWNVLVCVPLSAAIAVASWWLIEKPALGLRRYLK